MVAAIGGMLMVLHFGGRAEVDEAGFRHAMNAMDIIAIEAAPLELQGRMIGRRSCEMWS